MPIVEIIPRTKGDLKRERRIRTEGEGYVFIGTKKVSAWDVNTKNRELSRIGLLLRMTKPQMLQVYLET